MAVLTDAKYKMQGKTVLYVPNEGIETSLEVAAQNKEFVQRLESKYLFYPLVNFVFYVSCMQPSKEYWMYR